MTLPPYDPNSGCKMCGWEPLDNYTIEPLHSAGGTRFVPVTVARSRFCEGMGPCNVGYCPHIHRTCPRCGYEWIEDTIAKSAT